MPAARINNQPTVNAPFTTYSQPMTGGNPAAGGGKLGTNNHVAVFPFNLPYPMLITNLSVVVGTAGGAASNYDLGIYDTAGNLKAHVGAQIMNATGSQTFALTGGAVNLAAGTYLLALTGAATTLGIITAAAAGGPGAIYIYDTATTSTGGALPSSITLTNTTPTDTKLPVVAQWSIPGSPPPLFILT